MNLNVKIILNWDHKHDHLLLNVNFFFLYSVLKTEIRILYSLVLMTDNENSWVLNVVI